MASRVRPIGLADLDDLPRTCSDCDLITPTDPPAPWVRQTVAEWGQIGLRLVADDVDGPVTEAAVLIAPVEHRPTVGPSASAPISRDAAVLVSLRIVPGLRGAGLGRRLIQASAALAAKRGYKALEAVGTHGPSTCCQLSVDWLQRVGFQVTRDHPLTPRLRMDLSAAQTWRADLEAAWQRLTGLVVPPLPPRPVSRSGLHHEEHPVGRL